MPLSDDFIMSLGNGPGVAALVSHGVCTIFPDQGSRRVRRRAQPAGLGCAPVRGESFRQVAGRQPRASGTAWDGHARSRSHWTTLRRSASTPFTLTRVLPGELERRYDTSSFAHVDPLLGGPRGARLAGSRGRGARDQAARRLDARPHRQGAVERFTAAQAARQPRRNAPSTTSTTRFQTATPRRLVFPHCRSSTGRARSCRDEIGNVVSHSLERKSRGLAHRRRERRQAATRRPT